MLSARGRDGRKSDVDDGAGGGADIAIKISDVEVTTTGTQDGDVGGASGRQSFASPRPGNLFDDAAHNLIPPSKATTWANPAAATDPMVMLAA